MPAVATIVLRVWLPDRPGALGAVASRIGAVHGDVIGIDIIERGAGRAVDDLVVEIPDEGLVELLLAEVHDVDGVDVEEVRLLDGPPADPAVAALELAISLRAVEPGEEMGTLVSGTCQLLRADWAAVVDLAGGGVVARAGAGLPGAAWLAAFARGALTEGGPVDLQEVAVARLVDGGSALVIGRDRVRLRAGEREVLALLARLV